MSSKSDWTNAVDSKIFSILGALFGGFTGSVASRAFGGTAARNLITGSLILGMGVFLGIMIGTRLSEGLVRSHFGKASEKQFKNIVSVGIAFLGFLIAMLGSLIGAVIIESESLSSGISGDFIFGILLVILLYASGFIIIFWALGYLPRRETPAKCELRACTQARNPSTARPLNCRISAVSFSPAARRGRIYYALLWNNAKR